MAENGPRPGLGKKACLCPTPPHPSLGAVFPALSAGGMTSAAATVDARG